MVCATKVVVSNVAIVKMYLEHAPLVRIIIETLAILVIVNLDFSKMELLILLVEV